MSLRDKVGDIARRIRCSACCSQCEVNLTCEGRVLGRSAELRSSGVKDGSAVQVVRRMRGGGRHKDNKSEAEKKKAVSAKRDEQKGAEETKSDEGPATQVYQGTGRSSSQW